MSEKQCPLTDNYDLRCGLQEGHRGEHIFPPVPPDATEPPMTATEVLLRQRLFDLQIKLGAKDKALKEIIRLHSKYGGWGEQTHVIIDDIGKVAQEALSNGN